MHRINELYSLSSLVFPKVMSSAITSSFFLPTGSNDITFVADAGSPGLAAGKIFKMEILQSSGSAGTDATAIAAAENTFTADAESGNTNGRLITSFDLSLVGEDKPFLAARLSMDSGSPVVSLIAIQGERYGEDEINDGDNVSVKVV